MIPRTLRITRDHRVTIKNLEIGVVEKGKSGWKFTGSHEAAPIALVGSTTKLIKEQIAAHIPRDAYIKLVEDQPDG